MKKRKSERRLFAVISRDGYIIPDSIRHEAGSCRKEAAGWFENFDDAGSSINERWKYAMKKHGYRVVPVLVRQEPHHDI